MAETWIGSFRTSKRAGCIPNNRFKEVTGDAIRQLFRRGATGLGVFDSGQPDLLLGYIVTEKTRLNEPVVHYVWVRDGYREGGLAHYLFKAAQIDFNEPYFYTFWTKAVTRYQLFRKGVHEPAIARRRDA